MAIKGISNNVLHGSLVPKLRQALASANRNGMRRDKIEGIMQHVLGFVPDDDQFRHVMWVVHYQSGTNDLYYAVGNVPDEFKKAKKPKVEKKPKQSQSSTPTQDGQSITLKGDDMVVTVKGSGHDFKSKAVKVIIFISCLAGIFVVVSMF